MAAALTDEQVERLQLIYDQTDSILQAARTVGVSKSTASKYIDREKKHPAPPEVQAVRTRIKADIIAKMGDVQVKLLDAIIDPIKLREANVRDLGTTYGIVTDKLLLMQGEATARTETVSTDPAAKLTPEEMEAAARIRAKLAAEAS